MKAWTPAWWNLALLLGSGCAVGDLCEDRTHWALRDTAACVTCERECRSTAANMPTPGCDEEFACVARCPDRSALTCGCARTCLRTAACLAKWTEVVRCYSERCRDKCR